MKSQSDQRGREPPLRVFYKCKDSEIMEETKQTWGGARTGAGRKRQGDEVKVTLSFRISPSTAELIKRKSSELGLSIGAFIESLINKEVG